MVGRDIADDDAVHRNRDGNQRGVDQRQAANTPDPKGLEDGQKDVRKLVQESDGANNHGISILPPAMRDLPLRRVLGVAGEKVEGVGKQRQDGAQRALRHRSGLPGRLRIRELPEATQTPRPSAAKGVWRAPSWRISSARPGTSRRGDGQRGFGRNVARSQAGAAGGDNEAGARSSGAQRGDKLIELVGKGDGFDDFGARGGQDADQGRAGEVRLGAGEAAVADGQDDGGAASKGCSGRHISRIDADARNRAEDEKIEGPASFWSGDLSRRAQPSLGHIRHRLTT